MVLNLSNNSSRVIIAVTSSTCFAYILQSTLLPINQYNRFDYLQSLGLGPFNGLNCRPAGCGHIINNHNWLPRLYVHLLPSG